MTDVAIDHLIIATADLEQSAEPWRRLGFVPASGTRHAGQGTENAVVFIGDSPETMFYLEFLTIFDRRVALESARGRKLAAAIERGPAAFRIVLETADLAARSSLISQAGTDCRIDAVHRDDGSKIADVASLGGEDESSLQPRLIEYVLPREERFASRRERGLFSAALGLTRLDHLASVPADLSAATDAWRDLYGATVHGEVRAPGIVIRQLRAGDAIVELLAPDGPQSRLTGASPGLRSMLACEVDELEVAVATARERGFNPSDPTAGVLPGTRTATIPPAELGGVALQLLEYE
ncbi:MAG: VOC family protein [Dehalococcoidia bacterium]